MAELPALPLWTDAYLSDTGHLTTLEHGAYLLLLMAMWRAGGTLPKDDKRLSRFSHLTMGQWLRIKPTMMEFFVDQGDTIMQGRLTDELEYVRQHRKKQSDNARAKYRKNNNSQSAMGVPSLSQNAAPIPTPIPNTSSLRSDVTREQKNGFAEWYANYPNKVGRADAERAFSKALTKASPRELHDGLDRYLAKTDDRPWCNPATWLRQERWADQPAAVARAGPMNGKRHVTHVITDLLKEMENAESSRLLETDKPAFDLLSPSEQR